MNAWPHRITRDPGVLGGKPVVRGTRIAVDLVLELLAGGASWAEILDDYPHLTEADIRACLEFAASLSAQVRPLSLAS